MKLPVPRMSVEEVDITHIHALLRELKYHPEVWVDRHAAESLVAEKKKWVTLQVPRHQLRTTQPSSAQWFPAQIGADSPHGTACTSVHACEHCGRSNWFLIPASMRSACSRKSRCEHDYWIFPRQEP